MPACHFEPKDKKKLISAVVVLGILVATFAIVDRFDPQGVPRAAVQLADLQRSTM